MIELGLKLYREEKCGSLSSQYIYSPRTLYRKFFREVEINTFFVLFVGEGNGSNVLQEIQEEKCGTWYLLVMVGTYLVWTGPSLEAILMLYCC